MKKFFFDCGPRDANSSLGLFILRAGTGLMLLVGHGLGKIHDFAAMKSKFPVPDFFPLKYMSPSVSLMATIGAEVGCSALLVIGLATRPAAFILAFTMTVAAFDILATSPLFMSGAAMAKEPALLFLLPAVTLLLTGAGSISMDAIILKDRRRNW